MIIVLTVMFIMLAIRYFIKGQMFFGTIKEIEQMQKDKKTGKVIKESDLGIKTIGILLWMISRYITQIVYLIYTYQIDYYKFPTLTILFLMFMPLLFVGNKTTEYHKWTPISLLINLIWFSYLVYILLLISGATLFIK